MSPTETKAILTGLQLSTDKSPKRLADHALITSVVAQHARSEAAVAMAHRAFGGGGNRPQATKAKVQAPTK